MISTITVLLSGVVGFYFGLKARNPFTKLSTLLVSVAALAMVVPHAITEKYGPYLFALSSIIAGFEPGDSARLKRRHKIFFGIGGVIFAVLAVDRIIIWPINLTLWPLVLAYFVVLALLLKNEGRRLQTRLGVLVVWIGIGLSHLFDLL